MPTSQALVSSNVSSPDLDGALPAPSVDLLRAARRSSELPVGWSDADIQRAASPIVASFAWSEAFGEDYVARDAADGATKCWHDCSGRWHACSGKAELH